MHVGDTIFIFCLALIIFGPKKLPEIGRQIGKLLVEFRRASNEFKMQIEEELHASEMAERQKEISAKTTMLPAPAPSTETLPTTAAGDATPTITPPATGLPVSHTSPEPFSPEPALSATASADAYPESTNGFNPALNTASNGQVAEASAEPGSQPLAEPIHATTVNFPTEIFPPAEVNSDPPETQKTQAPAHHG